VYRAGFAQSQAAYEDAFNDLFGALDRVDAILAERRYLAGDVLTEADVRLFMTLIRFDPCAPLSHCCRHVIAAC
jgi:putative glutathione S-transferase